MQGMTNQQAALIAASNIVAAEIQVQAMNNHADMLEADVQLAVTRYAEFFKNQFEALPEHPVFKVGMRVEMSDGLGLVPPGKGTVKGYPIGDPNKVWVQADGCDYLTPYELDELSLLPKETDEQTFEVGQRVRVVRCALAGLEGEIKAYHPEYADQKIVRLDGDIRAIPMEDDKLEPLPAEPQTQATKTTDQLQSAIEKALGAPMLDASNQAMELANAIRAEIRREITLTPDAFVASMGEPQPEPLFQVGQQVREDVSGKDNTCKIIKIELEGDRAVYTLHVLPHGGYITLREGEFEHLPTESATEKQA